MWKTKTDSDGHTWLFCDNVIVAAFVLEMTANQIEAVVQRLNGTPVVIEPPKFK